MLTEVEELKKSNDELISKINDLENQMQTLEYVNQEFATQGTKNQDFRRSTQTITFGTHGHYTSEI